MGGKFAVSSFALELFPCPGPTAIQQMGERSVQALPGGDLQGRKGLGRWLGITLSSVRLPVGSRCRGLTTRLVIHLLS